MLSIGSTPAYSIICGKEGPTKWEDSLSRTPGKEGPRYGSSQERRNLYDK